MVTFFKEYVNIDNRISFIPDSKKLITSFSEHFADIWDIQTGEHLVRIKGYTGNLNNVSFSPDGINIITSSDDNICKLWNAESGKLLITFILINEKDYLLTDPNGRYDGSIGSRKLVYFVRGLKVINDPKLKKQLWIPNLVSRIICHDKIKDQNISKEEIRNPLKKKVKKE